ncbi:peptide-methionine (R)-S-oxide reductase, partial [Staphylococcus pettenkoferi]|uniref:peptide-methionine (R)-S-oxide reductase n=1 Tax=Staphylococcus pettenkoferi TaxID=170573 RepID=UPI001642D105
QYLLTQQHPTQPPFHNQYSNHFHKPIYLHNISAKPLFTSQHKFQSTSPSPTFSKPLHHHQVIQLPHKSHRILRTHV